MKNFSQQQSEIEKLADDMCRNLMTAAQADSEEIQAAADAPFLYQRMRAQLVTSQQTATPACTGKLAFWQFRHGVLAIAGVMLLTLIAWQGQRFVQQSPQMADNKIAPEMRASLSPQIVQADASQLSTTRAEKLSPPIKSTKTSALKPRRPLRRQAVEAQEITSDFMPLTYEANPTAQGGQIVRVEMPRATLLALGVPIPGEPTQEQMKADILLSNEGLALAIRLVR